MFDFLVKLHNLEHKLFVFVLHFVLKKERKKERKKKKKERNCFSIFSICFKEDINKIYIISEKMKNEKK